MMESGHAFQSKEIYDQKDGFVIETISSIGAKIHLN